MKDKLPLFELIINEDDLETGVDYISFVERPAIQKEWLAFAEDTYNDYPKSASNNAQRAIDWADEHGWGSCGTDVGKQRAHQLAKGENISRDTIARMASFRRHQQHKDVPYSEGCGGLMWDAWGGESGVAWAERKLEQIDSGKMRKMKYSIQDEDKHIVTGPAMLANRPIYRFDDKRGAYMVLFTPDTIFKIAKKFARKQHHNNVNENHADIVNGVSMFESYIIDRNRGIMPPKGYEDADDGSWFVSYVVDNDEIWGKVKGGEFTGFSVEGVFDFSTEIPISYIEQEFKSADDILLEKLYSIVSQWDGQ